MGAVNYGTSDYITIGYEPISLYDLQNDSSFMEELEAEIEEYGGTLEDSMQSYISDCEELVYSDIESILERYDFTFYHIKLKCGYYEGFYIDIKNNYSYCYNDYIDKKDAQREITQIKAFLIECVKCGLCQVYPGWVTSYMDYKTSIKAIKETIKAMRIEVKNTPTCRTLEI